VSPVEVFATEIKIVNWQHCLVLPFWSWFMGSKSKDMEFHLWVKCYVKHHAQI